MADIDLPTVFRRTTPTARKPHFCVECGDLIRPGDQYVYVTGCWEGGWEGFKTCSFCAEIAAELKEDFAYGQLEEALAYEVDQDHPLAQAWLAHTGRDLWKDRAHA